MISHRENPPLVDGGISSNAAANRPSLSISTRLASLLDLIARKLGLLDPLMEKQPDLRQITIIITLDKRGKPRTVILRTEAKSELRPYRVCSAHQLPVEPNPPSPRSVALNSSAHT